MLGAFVMPPKRRLCSASGAATPSFASGTLLRASFGMYGTNLYCGKEQFTYDHKLLKLIKYSHRKPIWKPRGFSGKINDNEKWLSKWEGGQV